MPNQIEGSIALSYRRVKSPVGLSIDELERLTYYMLVSGECFYGGHTKDNVRYDSYLKWDVVAEYRRVRPRYFDPPFVPKRKKLLKPDSKPPVVVAAGRKFRER